MSRVVDSVPPRRCGTRKHTWAKWLDGQQHVCERGTDFDNARRFANSARRFAKIHGLDVVVNVRGDEVYIMYTPRLHDGAQRTPSVAV